MKYNKSNNKKLTNTLIDGNRSQAEEIVINLLRLKFKKLSILRNDRSVLNKLEIDIYLPEFKFAIECDGIIHFKPIYGQETLDRVQKNDSKKSLLLEQKGIQLFRIDISKQTPATLYPYLKNIVNTELIPLIMKWTG